MTRLRPMCQQPVSSQAASTESVACSVKIPAQRRGCLQVLIGRWTASSTSGTFSRCPTIHGLCGRNMLASGPLAIWSCVYSAHWATAIPTVCSGSGELHKAHLGLLAPLNPPTYLPHD